MKGIVERPDGLELAWCEHGARNGRAVVYCHGMPGSRLEHDCAAELAHTRAQRIIVPDRPGYGASAPQQHRSIGDFARDAERLVDRLDIDRFDVVGFSGGGPYAMACAAQMPERVKRLALVSSLAPFESAGTVGMAERFEQLWKLAATDFDAFSDALVRALHMAGGGYELLVDGAPPADRDVFADQGIAQAYRANLAEALRPGLDGLLEDARAMVSDWAFDFARIEAPVRLWHGTEDATAPIGMGQWLTCALDDAALTVWEGAGHFEYFRRRHEVLDSLQST